MKATAAPTHIPCNARPSFAIRHSVPLCGIILLLLTLPLHAQTITTRTLDVGSGPFGYTGQYTSQAVVNGNPAIAYYNVSEGNLMFARNSAADGSGTWTISTVDFAGNAGLYASLKMVNGNPAISYYDATNLDLKYVRATDASGTAWGTPVTVDSIGDVGHDVNSSGDVGQYTSLAVVNGNPAISYYDASHGDLLFVRALDAGGTSWGTPVTVDYGRMPGPLDYTGNVGGFTSVALVDGNPAISYYDATNSDLLFVRALDAGGTSWGAPVTLDSSGQVGFFTSLAVVDGNPAISYYDGNNGTLKYVRALDASGNYWGTPIILDGGGNLGSYSSLALVDGNPAISYWDEANFDLKYVRALDAGGTSWGTPVTLDSSGQVGAYTSLVALVNGNPAISYHDVSNGNLKWARVISFVAPTVSTPTSAAVTDSSATLGGNVTSDGGAAVTARGVVYSLTSANADPLIGGSGVTTVTTGGTTGVFTTATGTLTANSAYSFKAYATNFIDTSYTSVATFTTQTIYAVWAIANGVSIDPTALAGVNLKAFAFGYTPGSPGALVYAGTFAGSGTITATGEPVTLFENITNGVDYRAVFVRRNDYIAAGLAYTPQFSPDLSTWQNSAAVPTVLADNGTNQIVSVPYPFFVAGKKARFFKISVSIAP